ncbi:MAG: deoxyribodipyrimidine photo-lyase [Proteobacteria bacterium]|jgi:deoxyribodipyrimidine photo-lyase|nr:deoxyribodipyrimidine photo-lyase [Pseudomonadota bacterium]
MKKPIAICWFRADLRLADNPALTAAARHGDVLPVFILDDQDADEYAAGGAARCWLHHCLIALNEQLSNRLVCLRGEAATLLPQLIEAHGVSAVFWNRCYEPWRIARDKTISKDLVQSGIQVETFNGSLLWEPWETCKQDGTPYRVFTPFYRRGCLNAAPPRVPLVVPKPLSLLPTTGQPGPDQLNLMPTHNWAKAMMAHWIPGEAGAQMRLNDFLQNGLDQYSSGRDFPAVAGVSRLSPYLHHGDISPNQVWHALGLREADENTEHFQRELGWREFSYHLLYHFPDLPHRNLQPKFDAFPWRNDDEALMRWQQGQTGYPIVDAGMRELWQTGYMHNRVRMIVASFLVKNLLLHWRHGERWFHDTLVDADLASNSASWQWVAGCGADAAPYFRIFNPITQGRKFDPRGDYTTRFVPELKRMPPRWLHCPWEAPRDVREAAGVVLGDNYPLPIVDQRASRASALAAFDSIRARQ